MGSLVGFEVDEDKAPEETVVENEVHFVFIVFNEESLLSGNEGEAVAEFQQELLQVSNQSVFQIALVIAGLLLQAQEFQIHRVFDDLRECFWCPLTTGNGQDGLFVIALEKTFVQKRVLLPLQLTGGPAVVSGFQFIVLSLVWVCNLYQSPVLCPVQL